LIGVLFSRKVESYVLYEWYHAVLCFIAIIKPRAPFQFKRKWNDDSQCTKCTGWWNLGIDLNRTGNNLYMDSLSTHLSVKTQIVERICGGYFTIIDTCANCLGNKQKRKNQQKLQWNNLYGYFFCVILNRDRPCHFKYIIISIQFFSDGLKNVIIICHFVHEQPIV
jgi:hypothetical protein